MILLDLVFAGFLIYGIISGLLDGFFAELASMVSLFVGVFLAFGFSYILKNKLQGYVSWNPEMIQAVSFLLTFIIVVVAITILGKVLTAFANFSALGLLNKIGGAAIGLLKSVLILGVALVIFENFNANDRFIKRETLDKSILYPKILNSAKWFFPPLKLWIVHATDRA